MIGLIKQHDVTDCGPACLASVASHYRLTLPITKIRQYANTGIKGTTILGLIEAAEKMGFEAKGVKGTSASLSKIPLPAIAHIITKEQLHHYVVLEKVSNKYVRIMDPCDGRLHQKVLSGFNNEWTGALLLLVPSEEFLTKNEKIGYPSRFWSLIKPQQGILIQILFGAIAYTLLGLSTAVFIQKITDYVIVDSNRNLLNLMSVAMIIIVLLKSFIGAVKSLFNLRIGQQIDAHLILGYYRHLLRLPQQFFDSMRIGEITSRINDAVKIRTFINDVSINLFVNVCVVVLSLFLLFTYYWKLAMLILIAIPFYILVYLLTNAIIKRVQRKGMEESTELEAQLVESLAVMGTIKRFGLEEFVNDKTERRFITLLRTVYQSGKTTICSSSLLELISQLLTISLLWAGTGYVLDREITPGELFSFYALTSYFTGPTASLIGANKAFQEAVISADRLFEIMTLETEDGVANIELIPPMIGDICFKNVAFRYGSSPNIFDNLILTIKVGCFTAIVGESGSGKSTLMALLQNIYPIQKGSIFIGKYAINYVNNASLRKHLAVVPQKIDLLTGDVIDNIAIGEDDPDMKRIIDICTQLGIISFIESLPDGFNTYLGENGATLSGGQRQRIAIARALYRNPEILILDEATSSLDSASEKFVQRTVNLLLKQHKTVIVIAHRLKTVQHADHIIVLDKGKVAEEGPHQTLLSKGGQYSKLWQYQH